MFFLGIGVLAIWFFYIERAILSPFILGGIFAYIFNPLVRKVSEKTNLSKEVAATLTYLLLMTVVVVLGVVATRRVIVEFSEIQNFVNHLLLTARAQLNTLPDWIKPTIYDFLFSIEKSKLVGSASLLPFFPQALSRIVSLIIFLVSGYYFLKEGSTFFQKIVASTPKAYQHDVQKLLEDINTLLAGYLRGQIFLIFLMSLTTFIALSILGVRFALFLGVFSGLAEIIPYIGPIIAATIAVTVVLVTGSVHFGMNALNGALFVVLLYTALRQIEDYLVVPHVMGRITKLPPFVIFFAVVAGGHIAGILGLILAVPVTAMIKVLFEFSLEQITNKS